jgi:predicted lipase
MIAKELLQLADNASVVYSDPGVIKSARPDLSRFIDNKGTDTQLAVFFDEESRTVDVSFRGTKQVQDFLTDLRFHKVRVPFANACKSHRGFLNGYMSVRDELMDTIRELDPERVRTEGHSLGGALATVFALDWSLKQRTPLTCVTFGSPRVGNRAFVNAFNESVRSVRVVNGADPVPFTPLWSMGFKHVAGFRQVGESRWSALGKAIALPRKWVVAFHFMENYISSINQEVFNEVPKKETL